MDLLDVLTVSFGAEPRTIELHCGDLTNLTPQESVDLLVVSSFPNNYLPITGTSIGTLYRRGVSVEDLAKDKAFDLRHTCSCWVSRELVAPPKGIQIKRILCYEPPIFGSVTEVVGDLFRGMAQVLSLDEPASIAIPLMATGDRGEPVSEVIAAILDAASHWMAFGLPLRQVRLVEQSSAKAVEVARTFARLKDRYPTRLVAPEPGRHHDLLISYASKDSIAQAEALAAALQRQQPDLRIVLDPPQLDPTTAWQQAIYERISGSRAVIALYSPMYLRSKACQEEYNLALTGHQAAAQPILMPVLIHDATLPAYMRLVPVVDGRAARDDAGIDALSAQLLAQLGW